MPTKQEFKDLKSSCYWVWTSDYSGKAGYIVYKNKGSEAGSAVYQKGTPNSSYSTASDPHIFLPAVGYITDSKTYDAGVIGTYWSSSLFTDYDNILYTPFASCHLHFYYASITTENSGFRCDGEAVRAVRRLNQFEESYDGNFESEKETKL